MAKVSESNGINSTRTVYQGLEQMLSAGSLDQGSGYTAAMLAGSCLKGQVEAGESRSRTCSLSMAYRA